jgi:hypothetical protein
MSPEVKKIYELVARSIENEIKAQAPSKKIASGTTVVAEFTGDNEVEFVTVIEDQVKYGIYLDKGTGKYRSDTEGKWNPNPGKGDDGIIPRFWTSLSDTFMERINMMIEEALTAAEEKKNEELLDKL